jgi:hypothetical protein
MRKLTKPAFALILILACSNAWTQSRSNPVIDEMIKALGGTTFLEVKEIRTSGRFFTFSKGELSGSDLFVDYIKLPDMERTEFGKDKNKTITINKGSEGWKIEGKNEPEPQPATQAEEFLENFKTSFDYVTRIVLKHSQTTVQSLPSELIDFRRADVVEVRDAAKNRIRLYIDRATHLPIKMQVRRANESSVSEERYGNWHEFQDVMTPLLISRTTNGLKTMEIRTEMAAYNSGLPDNLFAAPPSK